MKLYLVIERMPLDQVDHIYSLEGDNIGFLGSFAYRGGSHKYLREKMNRDDKVPERIRGTKTVHR